MKVMIYINDVNKESGAFRYLKKDNGGVKLLSTRRDYKNWKETYAEEIFEKFGRKWNGTRTPESVLNDFIQNENCEIVDVEDKAGTAIIFDNNCIHKGTIPTNGFRYAMTIQFKPVNSSGSSENANTYTVQSRYYTGSGTGTSEWNGSNDGNITIMKNQGSGAGKFISGHMYYFDPMNTVDGIKGYTWMARHRRNGDYTGLVYGGGGNATTTAYTGINIGASSGTITNGLFTVYGIVDGS